MTEPLIRLKDVTKAYKTGESEFLALRGVSLDIFPGELVAIIGPSGSGKSTLMHLLGCLDSPKAGSMEIDGLNVTRASSDRLAMMRREKIGFVFQSFNLLPRLTVLDNVALPLLYSGIPAEERRYRAQVALQEVELADRMHHRPLQLSGGQSQRVAIARALVNDPLLLLADEPTGALDTKTGHTILQLFTELHSKGRTIVMVTHDPDVASMAERRVEVRDGLIFHDGAQTPQSPLLLA
ncbi:MAG: ABC transporter ATP-binding protein [Verrucomicrobiales bacterium]